MFSFMTPDIIVTCFLEIYGEVHMFAHLPVEYGVFYFVEPAPFFIDYYQDWWIGGINDMAVWTEKCWEDYIVPWIKDGPAKSNYTTCLVYGPVNEALQEQSMHYHTKLRQLKKEWIESHMGKLKKQTLDQTKQRWTQDGSMIYTLPSDFKLLPKGLELPERRKRILMSYYWSTGECVEYSTWNVKQTTIINSNQTSSFSNLGTSLAFGSFGKARDKRLLIGAPGSSEFEYGQNGKVFSISSRQLTSNATFDLNSPQNEKGVMFYPPHQESNSHFGSSIVVIDFNLDGFNDVVISQPQSLALELVYFGQILVYLGNANGVDDLPSIIIIPTDNWAVQSYDNAGTALNTGDINADGNPDLIIQAPFRSTGQNERETGLISILFSSKTRWAGASPSKPMTVKFTTDSNVIIMGGQFFEWFGMHTVFIQNPPNSELSWLIVGSPGWNLGNGAVGKISCYSFNASDFFYPTLVWMIIGTDINAGFGSSFAFGFPFDDYLNILAMSIPNANTSGTINIRQGGKVVFIDITQLGIGENKTPFLLSQLDITTSIESSQDFSRFGQNVVLSDMNGDGVQDVIISESHYDQDIAEWSTFDVGRVLIYRGGPGFPRGHNWGPAEKSAVCLLSKKTHGLFGETVLAEDINGDGYIDLIVATVRDSQLVQDRNDPNAGSVTIFYGPLPF
jgi:glycosylphosphatidylinositol phospholipase D